MSDTLIKVENVSKKFCRSLKKSLWYGMQDLGNELLGRRHGGESDLRPDEFWAVKDVSFELKRGECLGLIGRNGAGKTTLLRMLNGLIKPDTGRIEIRGQVGAMIALGSEIKDILTGRENIYCSAAIRGFNKKQIEQKIDEIIEFSEIGDFIDSPVKYYSTGMRVRLNFAVASALEPDIFLLDEVLAVGDAAFRNKCYHRVAHLRKNAAVIFVSHNMEQMARISTQTLVMKSGFPIASCPVDEGIALYEQLNITFNKKQSKSDSFLSLHPPITSFIAKLAQEEINSGDPLYIDISIISTYDIDKIVFKVHFYNSKGAFAADSMFVGKIKKGKNNFRISLVTIPLKNGIYSIAFNLIDRYGDLIVWSYKNHTLLLKNAYIGAIADCQISVDSLYFYSSSESLDIK